MALFNNFIKENELIDPLSLNNKYTWSNLKLNPIFSRLDRFLFSKGWEQTFSIHTSRTLERIVLDHFPIVLESPHIKWGPCPFRLNNTSLKDKDFKKNFQDWWNKSKHVGFPGYAFIQSLKTLSKFTKNGSTTNQSPTLTKLSFASLSMKKKSKAQLCPLAMKRAPDRMVTPCSSTKKHWNNLKGDLLNVFKDFHKKGIVNNNINNTYIALINKKDKCNMPSDYRPISLTTSLYKIMAKALGNKLKTNLPDTVAENQMAFIKGRQITDAILITNEAIDTWKQRKTKGFVLKLDIEKAFDKISWSLSTSCLQRKTFQSNGENG
ncbi:LINE-1 retrotransposable element ORF2 protein [Cucumis melo var. makuwa]|uniref:LINE-1 retrotransposable element ORF2 protein n=1 Tax=Cucumis melo var. makuwa TaxID=1194695 RepID=A0A5D3CK94_CUCMM|nr:LINE-1 retrotransposable element ORF2 protein [Cucumis melo var. makuwa]TYK11584.1 LINE-1 retrotransposable element ORF2 protein [Cucumis melo var. makuwa]